MQLDNFFLDTYLVTFTFTKVKHKTLWTCACYTATTVVKFLLTPFWANLPGPSSGYANATRHKKSSTVWACRLFPTVGLSTHITNVRKMS